jgi:hypothetical protein
MAITAKRLSGPTTLTASAVTQYTVPGATTARVTELLIANIDTVDRTVTVHFVPSGGSVTNGNKVLNAVNIPANTTRQIVLQAVLATGDFISALASATSAINLMVSGAEIV